jgi:hypothetical protein
MKLGRHIPTTVLLILLLLSARAGATTYSAYKFEMLQGLAQSSDTVLTATVQSVAAGVRGDRYRETTDTRVVCLVTAVHLGPKGLKGQPITVVFGAADEPIREPSPEPVMLLLKKEGDVYRLSFYHRHGVFRLKNGVVQVAFEPKKKGHYWSYYTVGEIVSRIKSYAKSKVEVKLEVAGGASLSDGYLPVTFHFRNTGRKSVLILPPSYCFNTLLAEKVFDAGEQFAWEGVDHWGFVAGPEPLSKLNVGEVRSYTYRVPFDRLNIDAAGEYRLTLRYYAYQLSTWGQAASLSDKQKREAWLGVSKQSTVVIVKEGGVGHLR